MAAATSITTDPSLPAAVLSTAIAPKPVMPRTSLDRDLAAPDDMAPHLAAPDVSAPDLPAPDVMALLAVVLGAAAPRGLSGASSEQALQVVEAVEAVKAWADAVSIEATAVMVAELESDFADLEPECPTGWERRRFVRSCRSAAAREIQVATGLPVTACQRRVWLAACEPERTAAVLDLMRLGRVTLTRAIALTEATAHLDAPTAAVIASRVLRPLTGPDGLPLPGMAPLSQATFRARLHRQLVLHHGLVGQAERTDQEAVTARRVTLEPQRDGSGLLVITGDGPRLAAAHSRVETIARRLRNTGDPRTLDQLRADVATDLLLAGWIPHDPTFTALGTPPAAQVQVTVSLRTLMGLDQGIGQIPGWGAITAQQTRDLALQAGTIWKRLVTDPLTGRAIEVSAPTYKVPAGMAQQLAARDSTCRAPGCEIPAQRCDHDHTQEWEPHPGAEPTTGTNQTNQTTLTNLTTLHRGHHNLKTSGFWDSDQSPEGTVTWTTATGRTITTYPHVYDHPDNLPTQTSPLEARLGRQLAPLLNPDIPLPRHLNIFDHIDWAQALKPATPKPRQHQRNTTPTTHPTPWAERTAGPPPF